MAPNSTDQHMRFLKDTRIKNLQGMSIIELMVVLSISTVAILAITQLMNSQFRSLRYLSAKTDAQNMKYEVQYAMSRDANAGCGCVLGADTAAGTPSTNTLNQASIESLNSGCVAAGATPQILIKKGEAVYTGSPAVVSDIFFDPASIQPTSTPGSFQANLLIHYSAKKSITPLAPSPIHMVVKTTGTESDPILSCEPSVQEDVCSSIAGASIDPATGKCQIMSTESTQLCDTSTPPNCLTYDQVIQALPLSNSSNTGIDCMKAGGTPTVLSTGERICLIPGASCPTPFKWYLGWSATMAKTCTAGYDTCTTGFHSFSDNPTIESCIYQGKKCPKTRGCYYFPIQCSAPRIQIGCY